MTWASESKDPNSGNRVGSRPVPITADHQKLQSNYTSTIRQLKSDRSKLCMGFLQRVCDNSNCQFQHDEVARNSYVQEKSKLLRYYGYNATASGKLLCGFFSTGSICLRNPCPYVHEAGVRKVMLSKKIPPIWNNPLTCANWDALRDDPDPAAVQYLSWDVPGIDSHWNAERDDPDPAAVQYLSWDVPGIDSHWDAERDTIKMAMPRTRPKTPVNDPVLYYNVSRVAKQVPASTHQVSCQPHCSYENQETSRKPAPRPVYSSKDWQKKINNPVSTKQTEKRSNATTTKPTAVVLKIDENIRTVEQELTPLSVPKLEKLLVKLGPVKICADFPSIASWDTIPSAWDRWARKNLNPTCYQTLLPYILDGSLDHGFWPKGLRDYDAKGCFRNAKFHRFGELPTEIKKEIWKYALANNNHVARVTVHFDRVQQGPKFFRVNHAFRSANGGPPLLQTCCLSRVLAQQYYELAFATEANDAMCFVNFDTSRIFLNTRNRDDIQAFKKHLPAVDLEFIRHLVLPIRDFLIGDWASACDIWKKCTNLEHLTLLVGNSKEDSVADAASEAYRVRKYVRRWWVGKHEGKAVPEVELVRISAVKARLYRIDDLIYS